MTPLRYGIIGAGYIARTAHFPALKPLLERGEVCIAAVCERDPEALDLAAVELGAGGRYTDHHEMLERERLDALYVLLPPTAHTDAELIAAQRGIHLFVEKPVSLEVAQAAAFSREIERAGIISQVGFQSRYYPSAEYLRARLGDCLVRHANVQLFYSGNPIRYWTSRMELSGGSFVENTIHMVDLIRWFLGDITHASAFYVPRSEGDPERGPMNLPHAYLVNYLFEGLKAANFTTSRCLSDVRHQRRDVSIVCENAHFEWSAQQVLENGQVVWSTEVPENAFALQAAAFARAIREGDPTLCRSPYPSSLNSLDAVLAANRSAVAGGRLIEVAGVGGLAAAG